MYLKILLFLFFLCTFSLTYWAEEDISEEETLICDDTNIIFEGKNTAIVNFPEEYSLKNQSWSIEWWQITFTLLRDDEEVEKKEWAKYVRIFNRAGEATIKAEVIEWECVYEKTKNVKIYDQSYMYIWEAVQQIETNFSDFFDKKSTLFTTINSKKISLDLSASQWMSDFVNIYFEDIKKSKTLFIDESYSVNFFDTLLKIQKIKNDATLKDKEIYIITTRNYSFLSKVLAPYMNQMGVKKIWFVQVDNFLDSVNNIISKNLWNISYAYFDRETNFFSLNTFLRYLTYSWLELSFLGVFLSMALAILVVNFSKQFIWLNAFWVYYPILLALCLTLLNIYFVWIFLLLGFISIYWVFLISKKVHLLYYSKRSLLMTLFIILTLIFLGIDNYFETSIIDINIFSNKFILFPFIFLLLVADKVLHEEVQVFSKKWVLYFLELILITFISYFVINSSTIQYFLLSFPDVIFIVFWLNILVWRYTWLQLIEVIRFNPLLKKLSEEE